MSAQYDEGPELAPQNFPEVAPHQPNDSPHYGYQQPYPTPKPEGYTAGSTYAGTAPTTSPYTAAASPFSQHATTDHDLSTKKSRGVICGCSLLVFILSCIIALLSAAVIGLAAGTGVEANRANDATNKLAALSASVSSAAATKTSTAAAPTGTSFNDIDRGCSNDPDGVSGTGYTSFSLLGKVKFTVYCNRDAPGNSFMSLFAADLDTCVDACSSYSMYTPRFFGNNKNTTCGGVSFIPLWTDKGVAETGGAPGNCYLKPAPQTFAGLTVPQIGTECHAAILTG
ncbi:hypothetical protein CONLIGDRAFT_641753 [Coniochaeta ligniaria NRRL 30616]|uniref:Apple domain-containing protein n=1 Tax=Coniochaeta ligniaria NRRL 30616 TaxID=1408157 RepID=A0A1J7JPY0_9PEZI|nr:hypothetical protein CONLIGDRAFT_641753 [Coniochaeta ligniaria NRRL 30616]